jgi:vitamin B12/bleomycin/antimicrobial peptide transport system ATP-binding/permease protein
LSGRLIDDWLGDFAYYRRQFFRRPNDNPDQRIQRDIDIFTTGVGGQTNNPAYGSASTLLCAVGGGIGAILFNLSGPLTLGGITIPRALFWIVLVYVLAATVVAFDIGLYRGENVERGLLTGRLADIMVNYRGWLTGWCGSPAGI